MTNRKDIQLLVVDDEKDLRETIVFEFVRKGFTVFSSSNAHEAFEIVKSNKINLVISDIRMPGGDGMSLLEKIRAYDPEIPVVIFITGFCDYTEEESIAKGARKVVSKPFDRKILVNSVFEALNISE